MYFEIANARTVESTPPETAHIIFGFFSLTLILKYLPIV